MEMPCEECGGKSPMGSIFCRECGAKLDVNQMEPEVAVKSTDGGFKLTKFAVRRLISLAVTVVILGALACLFVDTSPTPPEEADPKRVDYIEKVYLRALAGDTTKKRTFAFTDDELTSYMKKQLDEMQSSGGADAMRFNHCIFDFYDENMIKIDLQATMNAIGITKDIAMQMVFSFENGDDGVTFNIEGASHGMFPMPGFMRDKMVTSRFERLIPVGDDLEAMIAKLKSLEIVDGKLTLNLKEPKKDIKKK